MNRRAEIPLDPDEPALPWSCEAEQSVLGGMLLDPDASLRMADVPLRAEHFFDAQHRAIWGVMSEMAARRQPIDVVTVFERLQSAGRAEESGGVVVEAGD